jgi:GntR family transcriptional regulator
MTISKAYGLLEAEGVVERIRGVGMKVAHRKDLEQSLAERLRLLGPTLEVLATQVAQLQIPKSEAIKAIRSLLEKES